MALVAAAGLLASIEACGGKVIIDQPTNGGTGGSGSSSSQASSSSGTAPYECEVEAPDGYKTVDACTSLGSPGQCPSMDDPIVFKELYAQLNMTTCDGFCCTQDTLVGIACGPDPTVDLCCYTALVESLTFCEGDSP